ncbi:nucleoside-diphosphate kinase, partial [Patescibacteria group bacterium]|nr:nucleoside-diphosphate kinase [Patescibacteria group bacterium]
KRGLIGEIIKRFEQRGLKIIALKMVYPTKEHAAEHYSGSKDWLEGMGRKTLDNFKEHKMSAKKLMATDDPYKIGKMIQKWNVSYLASGPIVAMIIEGMHAISTVRKLVGNTLPILADPGTIRGDFSVDTNTAANLENRTIRNIVHASGDESEASHEIEHWFSPEEICDYKRSDEEVMFA